MIFRFAFRFGDGLHLCGTAGKSTWKLQNVQTLVFQIPPEKVFGWCVFGVQIPLHKVFGTLRFGVFGLFWGSKVTASERGPGSLGRADMAVFFSFFFSVGAGVVLVGG